MELTEAEVSAVLLNYAVGELQSLRKISRGYINYNWLLKTRTGTYVLRAAPTYRSRKELLFEHAFLQQLHARFNYAIPNPIGTVKGSTLCTYKQHIFWLYQYIPGEVITTTTNSVIKQVARMMASMHSKSAEMKIEDGKGWPNALNKRHLLLDLNILQQKLRLKRSTNARYYSQNIAAIKECVQAVDPNGYSALPRFPIHADIYNPNLIFYKGKLRAVLDFDNSHFDTAIADISCYLQASCRKGHKLDLVKAKLFLAEYRKHRPLSRQEVRYLPDIAIMGYAGSFYFFSQANEREPNSTKLQKLLRESKLATEWCTHNRVRIQAALV